MVAKIISGKSLIGALNYNENKVQQGKADLIHQNGYAKDIIHLNFNDKLLRLKDLSLRNERVKTNTVHISLNFAAGEKLSPDLIREVTDEYMERIGFGAQPYLVYRHNDAGHPHVHIVSTNIKSSGERISLHNLGKTKSEDARKALEEKFGLTPAMQKKEQELNNSLLTKVEYGKTDTKRALANTINAVIKSYRFTSLAELNAVLQNFNVLADRGSKDSRMYAKNGLIYWALDANGNKLGVPIKASAIYGGPTLKNLQARYKVNEERRKVHKERVKSSIDSLLITKASKTGFKKALQSKGIDVVFRHTDEGRIYGVTFVDHQSKVVFNGSDLGKAYSAAALEQHFLRAPEISAAKNVSSAEIGKGSPKLHKQPPSKLSNYSGKTVLDGLLRNESDTVGLSSGMTQNKRKKKRRRLSN